jgi:predicted ATP-grasp superfamily ATP-dependent carboligase
MTPARPAVLLLGTGLPVLGAIRLLTASGFDPFVVGDAGDMVRRSRWFRPAPQSSAGVATTDDLPAYLEGLPFDRAALLPCSDAWTLTVAEQAPRISSRFPSTVAPAAALHRLIDKWRLAEVMAEARLPHPKTVAIDAGTDLNALPEQALAGAFMKPRDSLEFFRRFHVKAFRVGSREEIAARLRQVEPFALAMQLQEYIPGPPGNHYFVDGFIDRSGTMTGVFVRRRLRMYPPDFGNSTAMVSVPVSEVPDAIDTVTCLLAHVGFHGVFSAELKRDSRDGVCRLIEVNVRPWWYVEFAGRCGVDVCTMAVREALGMPSVPVRGYQAGRTCVYRYYDYFACRTSHREGKLSLTQWIASWARASQPVFRWDDPWPALAASAEILGGRIAKLAGRTNSHH